MTQLNRRKKEKKERKYYVCRKSFVENRLGHHYNKEVSTDAKPYGIFKKSYWIAEIEI